MKDKIKVKVSLFVVNCLKREKNKMLYNTREYLPYYNKYVKERGKAFKY